MVSMVGILQSNSGLPVWIATADWVAYYRNLATPVSEYWGFFISFLLISTVDRSAWTRYRGVWGRRQPLIHLAEKNGRLDSSP